jgi:bla regulator protein blaR1
MRAVCIGTTICIFAAGTTFAQPAANPLTFEVASVKPSALDTHGFVNFLPGGGLRVVGIPLKTLITLGLRCARLPDLRRPRAGSIQTASTSTREAKLRETTESAPADLTKMTDEQRKTMAEQAKDRLKNLLAERFQLAIHRETKEQQVYALVVAKGGPKLQESKDGQGRMRMGRALLSGQGVELGMLTFTLSDQLGRLVIDKTSLSGKDDFELNWTPDPGQPAASPLVPAPPGVELPPPPDPNGPSIFTAVEEQLGLHLESQKAPVETLVIDRVEKPSEN